MKKLIIFLILLFFSHETKASTNNKIRVAFFPNFTHGQALIGISNKLYEKYISKEIDWKAFNAGPSAMEALLAGEVDFAFVGVNPSINAYLRSKGKALKIIAGSANGGACFVIRKDLTIKSINDFKGKSLASPEFGNTQDISLKYWLKKNGLLGLVKTNNVKNPDIYTLFVKKSIDGAWIPEPWVTRIIQEAGGKIYIDERGLWPEGKFATSVLVVRKEFLDKNPETVEKFLKAHIEITDWINKNPEEAKNLINNSIAKIIYKPLPKKVIDEAFTRINFSYDPITNSIFDFASHAKELGYLPKNIDIDLKEIFELSILNRVLIQQKKKPIK